MSAASITADGNYCEIQLERARADLEITGAFGGGTVTVEVLTDAGTWEGVTDASYTFDTIKVMEFTKSGKRVRLAVLGSTTPVIEAAILQ